MVDAVAVDVIVRDHDIAQMYADAELQTPRLGLVRVAPPQILLDLGGAGDRVGDRGELGQKRVARGADDAPRTILDARGHRGAVFGKRAQRRFLVGAHQAGVSRDIGGEDGGKSAFDGFGLHERTVADGLNLGVAERRSPSWRPRVLTL